MFNATMLRRHETEPKSFDSESEQDNIIDVI